jgi:hypothetical protein
MMCSSLKHNVSKTKILALDDTRACIESYDAKSSTTANEVGSQVSSQSSGSSLGHTHLPQQSQNSDISAHI